MPLGLVAVNMPGLGNITVNLLNIKAMSFATTQANCPFIG